MPVRRLKSLLPKGHYYFSGNEAAAEGALAAGCRFYAGYPITPSSEIMERLSWRMSEVQGSFIQMEDEIGSISAVVGASWAGVKAMTATSGPGFSLMQETIGYAAFTETPCLIIDVQRAGPCTGQATRVGAGDIMQTKWGSHGDYQVIAFSPWSVQEMYDLTIRLFNLSEQYRVPGILLAEEAIGHLRENMRVSSPLEVWSREKQKGAAPFDTEADNGVPPMPAFGEGEHLAITGSTHDGYGFRKTDDPKVQTRLVQRINAKITSRKKDLIEGESYFLEDARTVIVAYGFTARSSLFAVKQMRQEGLPVGLLRLKTLWPFPDETICGLGKQVKKILVPEMNLGQVAGEVQKYTPAEIIPLGQTDGEIIRPESIIAALRRMRR